MCDDGGGVYTLQSLCFQTCLHFFKLPSEKTVTVDHSDLSTFPQLWQIHRISSLAPMPSACGGCVRELHMGVAYRGCIWGVHMRGACGVQVPPQLGEERVYWMDARAWNLADSFAQRSSAVTQSISPSTHQISAELPLSLGGSRAKRSLEPPRHCGESGISAF